MEKKRVRIYKAEQGGSMMNPLSDFITKAQYGQQQQVDPQQLVMQTVSAIAPAELGGQGNDPNDEYMRLAQTHGQEMASSIINAAVGYIQQMTSGAQSEQAQSTEPVSDQLSIQEELIAQERERQRIMQEQMAEQEDDDFMDELLYGEAKEGGSLDKMKKQYVKSAVKLAKKQLGDAGTNNEQPVDSTDIREGRNSKVSNFLTSVQNNAYLSQVEKQAENMFMQQFGGNISPDLYKYVYGGYDPSIPELTMAQNGITVTDKWGNAKQMSQEDADYWYQLSSGNPDLRLTDFSLASDAPTETDSDNLTDQQRMFYNAGKLSGYPSQGYYPNYVPYSTDNFWNSVIPYNRGQKKTVLGQGRYDAGSLPFSPYFGPDLSGFEVKKERLGLGSKKYTYRPLYGTDTPESSDELTKDKRERQGPFSNLGEKLNYGFKKAFSADPDKQKDGRFKGFMSKVFTKPEQAKYGLQKFQGNEQGNQVNNQNQTIPELKPKSSKEVWQTTRPEIMESWGVKDIQSGEDLLKDWEMEMFEMKEFDPQQALLAKNVIGSGIASIGSSPLFDKGARQAQRDAYTGQTMDNIAADTFYTQPGTYFTNAEAAFRGKKPGAPQGEGFEAIVKYGGPIMAKGGTPYPQRFGSLQITPTAMGGNDIDQYIGKKKVEVKDSLGPEDRSTANLEAEGGETAYGDINGDGFPEHYKINGPRHTEGGVPLNLPDGTFIFSDTRSMKITDCNILKMFNKPCGKGGFTPATLAKPYDINSYRKILQDPTSDQLDKKTAELMIKQYVLKLGALALAQESKKGFPQGIPEVARPYMEAMGIKDEDLLPKDPNATEGTPQEMDMMAMTSEEGMPAEDEMMEQPMAMYGMTMGGYDLPFAPSDYMYKQGGQLDKYQDKGEVKTSPKVYTKESLPEGAVIKTSKDAWNLKTGEFVLQPDGTYRKVTLVKFDPRKVAVDTGTKKQTVQDFMSQAPENKQIIERANAIIEKAVKEGKAVRGYEDANGRFIKDDTKNGIKLLGNLDLSFQDRIILSRALNSNANFGTDKYTVLEQGYTPQYTGKGAFTSGFTPEDYEKRFIFEKARGAGNTDDEAFAIVDQVYNDPVLKAKFRRDYLTMLGIPNVPANDEELLKPDFYKTRYSEVTKGMENVLARDFARPSMGDDALAGFEHFDAFGFSPDVKYEYSSDELENEQTIVSGPGGDMMAVNIPVPKYAPWWLQDTIGTAGAAIRMFSRQDQFPPSFRVDYEEPRGPFLDPARELAAQSESSNKMINYLSKFAGPQNLVNIASNIMGQDSKAAADILAKYNNADAQLARQDDYAGVDIRNREADNRMKAAQAVVDATNKTIAGRQNTRLADMNFLEERLKSAITNRWLTDTVNQMYPDFAVDPSIGGKLIKTPGYKTPSPTKPNNLDDYYSRFYDLTGDKEEATKLAMFQYNKDKTGAAAETQYPIEAIMSMYNREYGGELPEAQTGLIKQAGNMLSKIPGISRIINPSLVRFTGSALPQMPQSNLVKTLGNQTPISLSELNNLQLMPEYLPEIPENYPVIQAGLFSKLPSMPASVTDFGKSVGDLLPFLAGTTLKTPTSLNPESLSSMGTVTDPKNISDDELINIITKVDFTKPVEQWVNNLHPTELLVLKANKDRVNILKDSVKTKSKAKTKTVAASEQPKAPTQPISKDELNETSLELYGLNYKDLSDAQMIDVISFSNFKKMANPPKKSRAKKTKNQPASPATQDADLVTQTREKMAMDNYGESYETLSGLAKKMIDNEVQRLLGSETPPFQLGGIFVMGSNVFPPIFY